MLIVSTPATAGAGPSGTAYAWGDNTGGKLGYGTTNTRLTPTAITLAPGVHPAALSAGGYHTLAIGTDGRLYAWGYNGQGELGDGTTTDRHSPEAITLASGVLPKAISVDGFFSLAIGSDGNLYAWGQNQIGQLGDGTTTDRSLPEVITLAVGVHATAISAGYEFGLAIGSDGNLYTWGYNGFGQLGDGTTSDHTPKAIILAPGVLPEALSAGPFQGLAIGSDGNLYAWGDNSSGELGDGTTINRLSPVVITLVPGVNPTAISAGQFLGLAIGSNGSLYSWGSNQSGQLGDGSTIDHHSPQAITLAPGVQTTAISAGRQYSGLAIGSDRNLYAWGNNSQGELGDGTTTEHDSPEAITLANGVDPVLISAGDGSGMAIGVPTYPDHFLCYQAPIDQFTPHTVNLQDQFGSYSGVVAQPAQPIGDNQLCNPVEKTVGNPGVTTPVNNPQAHLYCYSDNTGQPPNQTISVDNQFGTGSVLVGASTRLCLPSWKFDPVTSSDPLAIAGSVPPGSWTDPIALGLDHYQCYSVQLTASSGQFANRPATVGLHDQFATYTSIAVGAPTELCTPVTKSIAAVGSPPSPPSPLFGGGLNGAYLLCYAVATGTPRPVEVGNQFSQSPPGTPGAIPAPVQVVANPADQLCLPSTATVAPPSTPEAPAALLLPIAAAAIGLGGLLIVRRRNRRSDVA